MEIEINNTLGEGGREGDDTTTVTFTGFKYSCYNLT